MLVPLSWLRDYVPLPADPAALVERLTLATDRRPDDLVDLVLAWETTRVRISVRRPFP